MVGLEALLTVSRVIPQDVVVGLLTGAYKTYGGVVRDGAGRIVAHLGLPTDTAMTALSGLAGAIPGFSMVADAFQAYQLQKLGLVMEEVRDKVGTVLNLSIATTAMSGLGLVVSIAGFAFLARKLVDVQKRLDRIEQTTKKSLHILEAFQYGKLKAALDNLRHASDDVSDQVRHDCLMQAKRDFAQLTHHYQHLWREDTPLEDVQVLDDSYTIAMLGAALASNELGLRKAAEEDFRTHREAWQALARAFVRRRVSREDPQRLLHHRYVAVLPADALFSLLDFQHDSVKGPGWFDELRRREAAASVFKLPAMSSDNEEALLQVALRFAAKDRVLAGHEAHLRFLRDHSLSESDFQRQVASAAGRDSGGAPLWISLRRPVPRDIEGVLGAAR